MKTTHEKIILVSIHFQMLWIKNELQWRVMCKSQNNTNRTDLLSLSNLHASFTNDNASDAIVLKFVLPFGLAIVIRKRFALAVDRARAFPKSWSPLWPYSMPSDREIRNHTARSQIER